MKPFTFTFFLFIPSLLSAQQILVFPDSLSQGEYHHELYNGQPYLYFTHPDFSDFRCIDELEGIYWNDNDYFMETYLMKKVAPDTLILKGTIHNSKTNDRGTKDHWREDYPAQVLKIGPGVTKKLGNRNYTTTQIYCVSPTQLAKVTIQHDFRSEVHVKYNANIGRPSTQFNYIVWGSKTTKENAHVLYEAYGSEVIFHRSHSPYVSTPDFVWDQEFSKAGEEKKLVPLALQDSSLMGQPYLKLPKGRIPFVPLNEASSSESIDEAPFLLYGERLALDLESSRSIPFAASLKILQKKKATDADFEARKHVINQEILHLMRVD